MKRDAKVGLAVVLVVCISLAVVFGRNMASQATPEPSVANVGDELDSLEGTLTGTTTEATDDRLPTAPIDEAAIDDLMEDLPTPSTPTGPPTASVTAVEEPAAPAEPEDLPVEAPIEDELVELPVAAPAAPAVPAEPAATGTTDTVGEAAAAAVEELPNPADLEEIGDEPVAAPTEDDLRAERERPAFAGVEETAVVEVPAAAEPAAPAPRMREYSVASGDSLWKIAKKLYGRGESWDLIAKANSIDASTPLRVGRKLRVPIVDGTSAAVATAPETPAAPAAPAGSREYEVKSGDSFWKIAARELGSGARFAEIGKLNPGVDSATLRVGQKIRIPEK